jgi:hypothetical protein
VDQGNFLGPCISCDLARTFQFEMFPNPTDQELTIYLNGIENIEVELMFFDNLGRPVLQKNLEEGLRYASIHFDVSAFSPGSYYVRAANSTTMLTKKLVVTR